MIYIYYRDANHDLHEVWIHKSEYREWLEEIKPLVIYEKLTYEIYKKLHK